MAVTRRTQTTKDISLLSQLYRSGQLRLAPEFQRQGVWPRPAKAYLIDTILEDKPIPLLFFTRETNAQTSRPAYAVVDGQQRLRAIFDFLDNRLTLPSTASTNPEWRGLRFRELTMENQERLLNYDLSVVELYGYGDDDIRDVFVRMNRFVVKLARQELRHAREKGAFKEFINDLASQDFWALNRVFTAGQKNRMRNIEFIAEIVILLSEGPQDKKDSIDLYYQQYEKEFPLAGEVERRLGYFQGLIADALPSLSSTRWRKPVDLYALFGAMDYVLDSGGVLDPSHIGLQLRLFETSLGEDQPSKVASRYLAAASRQTDNLRPRETRIEILAELIGDIAE